MSASSADLSRSSSSTRSRLTVLSAKFAAIIINAFCETTNTTIAKISTRSAWPRMSASWRCAAALLMDASTAAFAPPESAARTKKRFQPVDKLVPE